MTKLHKSLLNGAIILIALIVLALKYWQYVTNPWTRDGQIRAQVIQITPRISGPIVKLPIKDNQFVKQGDLLFEIDPRTFKASLDQALAKPDQTRDEIMALEQQVEAEKASVDMYTANIEQAKAEIKSSDARLVETKATYERMKDLVGTGAISKQHFDMAKSNYLEALAAKDVDEASLISTMAEHQQSLADLAQAKANLGAPGDENAQLRAAKAAAHEAELNLEFTRVKAPVDGYVTNLNLRLGSQGVANQPALALVDVNSFWVHGFFKETDIENIQAGNGAIITLMTYPDTPIEGYVDSIGWGIAQDDGSAGYDLLPSISATFEWIRLAQRVPVRVHLDKIPENIKLRVGTTASVLVMTGTNHGGNTEPTALPRALQ